MIFGSFRHFSRKSHSAAAATLFDTVLCLRSPAIVIHDNSTFATSQNAAPAMRLQGAAAHEKTTLPKYCACHAKRKRHRNVSISQNATKTRYICEEMDLEHVIVSTFSVRRPTVRLSALTANTLPTVAVVETTLGEHDSNLQTSRVKREPFMCNPSEKTRESNVNMFMKTDGK